MNCIVCNYKIMDFDEYDWDDDEEFYQNGYTINNKFINTKQKNKIKTPIINKFVISYIFYTNYIKY